MTPLFRRNSADATNDGLAVDTTPDSETSSGTSTKGRPTPKRRTSSKPAPRAPRTRKEAAAWQKQQGAKATVAGQKKMTTTEYKAAMKAGDPRVLPKRDQGEVRALARDYVDSHRMASNYLLLLIPLYVVTLVYKPIQLLPFILFLILFVEWLYTGRKLVKLAAERKITHRENALSLGFYAGSRAYFRRAWRRPAPRVELGQKF